jgi:hypothetical protein
MSIRSVYVAALFLVLGFGLAACASRSIPLETTPIQSDNGSTNQSTEVPTLPATLLPDMGPAPDFDNEIWLNTDQSPDLATLRGRVVLVEFWTFG